MQLAAPAMYQYLLFSYYSPESRLQWGSVVVQLSAAGRLARDDEPAARRLSADYMYDAQDNASVLSVTV